MKCTNKVLISLLTCVAVFLCGCASSKYAIPFTADSNISSFRIVSNERMSESADSFSSNLCVAEGDINNTVISDYGTASGGLFDINSRDVIFADNIHEQLHPASLTKIMTAIVAMKHCSLDTNLYATTSVNITEPGAQLLGLKPGDSMTLDQALHILLIHSDNDVAILIAEGVAGSVDEFVNMMNEEALALGATNTHFVNPHGLTADEHYTTAYDMYLIMNEAVKYALFNEIIHSTEYQTVYYNQSGTEKEVNVKSTNLYLQGNEKAPAGITVVGGKTGTTNMAGHCLVLLSRDTKSNPFISIVMKCENRDDLYAYMNKLLSLIK